MFTCLFGFLLGWLSAATSRLWSVCSINRGKGQEWAGECGVVKALSMGVRKYFMALH